MTVAALSLPYRAPYSRPGILGDGYAYQLESHFSAGLALFGGFGPAGPQRPQDKDCGS